MPGLSLKPLLVVILSRQADRQKPDPAKPAAPTPAPEASPDAATEDGKPNFEGKFYILSFFYAVSKPPCHDEN